ncbi:hypothetical protein ACHAXA_003962 [Cyclostephanos tholiformis]|uniref:Sulfate transporter n=1 Tax=Cyclostephanos tholiformis TaxID=382380 RepID=A0ABD3R405_9STRA
MTNHENDSSVAAQDEPPPPSFPRGRWWDHHRHRSPIGGGALRLLRERTIDIYANLSLSELSGSLGDLGTFIPLTVALARERKIVLAPALFWAGASNVITGYIWDVPMCVQPMKSIAAVALTDVSSSSSSSSSSSGATFDAGSVTTAGILSGAVVLFLGVTNLMEVVNWIVPMTVVCGLQVGVGLRLASTGIRDVQKLTWIGGYDCITLAITCALLSMLWLRDNEDGTTRVAVGDDGPIEREGGGEVGRASSSTIIVDSTIASSDDGRAGTLTSDDDANDSMMEMGRLENDGVHRLETATTVNPQWLSSCEVMTTTSVTTTACVPATEWSASSAPRTVTASPPTSASCRFARVVWNRACCCLNPFPPTPHPVGIYLFLIGCIFAGITLGTANDDSGYDLPLGFFGAPIVINALRNVTPYNWKQGFFQGTLPQLPLTTLNSVISVCCLAHALYPERRDPSLVSKDRTDAVVTRREVCVSVGLMNLLLCPLGSMPNCHGAGGLAGQHRFGARHGTSVVVLGLLKMFIAIFLGGSALTLLDALPVAVLGIMLVIAGLELVGTGVGMLVECIQKEKDRTRDRIDASGSGDRLSINSGEILRKNTLIAMVTAGVIVVDKIG